MNAYKDEDIQKFQEELTRQKERLVHELNKRENDSLGKSMKDSSGEVSSYKIHMADLASDNSEEDTSLDILSSEESLLEKIQKALRRIEKDIYGKCLRCGKNIAKGRLKAIPYAELCHDCQEKEEITR